MKRILYISALAALAIISSAYAGQMQQAEPAANKAAASALSNAPAMESAQQSEGAAQGSQAAMEASKDAPSPSDDKLHLYIESQEGNFKLKPGTVYHWSTAPDDEADGGSKYYKKKLVREFAPSDKTQTEPQMQTPAATENSVDISNTPAPVAAPSSEQQLAPSASQGN